MEKVNFCLAFLTFFGGVATVLLGLFLAPVWLQTIVFGAILMCISSKFCRNAQMNRRKGERRSLNTK